jgi:ATP-dependent RNA helicase DeaD
LPFASQLRLHGPEQGHFEATMDSPDSNAGFHVLNLAPPVLQAVQDLGYEVPTAVQEQCVPQLLAGRDLLGQAQTGTGKTAAFALPLLSRIDLARAEPQVLVLTPTRELALQVAEAFQRYAKHLPGFHVLPLYGGQSYALQIRQLRRGPQVVVGTPGRVMDHMRRTSLSLGGIQALVLDEADEMLNMGFAEDIEWIFAQAPAERQVALFSATLPEVIRRVAEQHLKDPIHIEVAADTVTVASIEQRHCVVTRYHKLDLLTRVLEIEPFDAMLIFVRTKTATVELKEKLVAHGFAAEALNGDLTQDTRENVVARLRNGRLDILVATDVAARGLDVERITHVINFDIPTDPSAYVHRIGRTGRAGRAGTAILFVEPRERHLLRAIEHSTKQRIPLMEPPSAREVSESRIGRFVDQLRTALAHSDLDFFYRLVARIAHEQEVEVMDIAAALTFLIQRERPLDVKESPIRPERVSRSRGGEEGPATESEVGRERRRGRDPYTSPDSERERPPRKGRTQGPLERRQWRERHDLATARVAANAPEQDWSPRDRPQQGSRPPRSEQRPRDRASRHEHSPATSNVQMLRYRIEVGRSDGVTPREIVGAIANEAGLDGRYIGRIEIRDDHSVLDLPEGMPREIYRHLQKVYVCGKALRLHPMAAGREDKGPAWKGGERLGLRSSAAEHDRSPRPRGRRRAQ